jgi:hypothetical protein
LRAQEAKYKESLGHDWLAHQQGGYPDINCKLPLTPIKMSAPTNPKPRPKALLFDFMGTCLDWHTSITQGFSSINPSSPINGAQASEIAMAWRLGYFKERRARSDAGLSVEDIDVTHRRVLDRLLKERGFGYGEWREEDRQKLAMKWHSQLGTLKSAVVLWIVSQADEE